MTILCNNPKCRGVLNQHTPAMCPNCGEPTGAAPMERIDLTSAKEQAMLEPTSIVERLRAIELRASELMTRMAQCERETIGAAASGNDSQVLKRLLDLHSAAIDQIADQGQTGRAALHERLNKLERRVSTLESPTSGSLDEQPHVPPEPQPEFTPDQMIAAIRKWLEFGNDMSAFRHGSTIFSGDGWAARALRAAMEFIDNAAKT